MNITFVLIALAICAITLTPIFYRLLSQNYLGEDQNLKRAKEALNTALAAEVITQSEYDAKLAALIPKSSNVSSAAPAATALAASLAVVLPLGALLIYRGIGEPRALQPASHIAGNLNTDSVNTAPDLSKALQTLESRLQSNPDDAEGWRLLARGYRSMQQFDQALSASRKVRELLPDNLDAEVEYIEALALSTPNRSFFGEPQQLLDAALAKNPNHQRALWLAGIAASQRGEQEATLQYWNKLAALLPTESETLAALQEQINALKNNAMSNLNAAPKTEDSTGSTDTHDNVNDKSSAISIMIDVAPELKKHIMATDTLFVFARAAQGQKMPLAIQRLSAKQLPIAVTLDDSMSMLPNLKLSAFNDIVIGARISRSGDAIAASGDFQTLTAPLARNSIKEQVQLTINETVP